MHTDRYKAFLASEDTLRIYQDKTLAFSSKKDRLLPLMEYSAHHKPGGQPVVIFDRIMGNAAALLVTRINCREVYSPLGSEPGVKTLESYGIKYHLDKIIPYIQRPDGKRICPMEELSINKTPDEFYREMKTRIEASK